MVSWSCLFLDDLAGNRAACGTDCLDCFRVGFKFHVASVDGPNKFHRLSFCFEFRRLAPHQKRVMRNVDNVIRLAGRVEVGESLVVTRAAGQQDEHEKQESDQSDVEPENT